MIKKIFIFIGVFVLALLMFASYVWYRHVYAINTFSQTDYSIVYTFRELPESVKKEFLAKVHIDSPFAKHRETYERQLRQAKKSEQEIQEYFRRAKVYADAMSNIADPGEPVNLGDVFDEPLPNKLLIFAGIAEGLCFIYYIQGGFGMYEQLIVYTYNQTAAQILLERDLLCGPAKNIDDLRRTISANKPKKLLWYRL